MTKEKKASLKKYIDDLSFKLQSKPTAKHVNRNGIKEYHDFLKLEIIRTKTVLEAVALAESGK